MVQHNTVRGVERLHNRRRRLKGGLAKDVQDLGVNMVEGWPPGAMLVTEVFPASSYLSHPESNSLQCIPFVFEVCLEFCQDFVSVHVLLHQKSDDDSLLSFNLHGW
jgi:hypothetical protein